jgi:phage terminase small subunit
MKQTTHKKARAFFKQIKAEYELSRDEIILLEGCCENLSMYWLAADSIAVDGLTFKNEKTGQIRKNPAVEICKNSWAGFLAGCRILQVCQPGEKPKGGRGIKK